MIEIERKFLVTSASFVGQAIKSSKITQGFLSAVPQRTVRIRIKDTKGFITVKGASSSNGMSRFEWEKEILVSEAQALLTLCEETVITKIRHEVNVGDKLFEVDVFKNENEGLIIAEVELTSEDEFFDKPDWLGKEVTTDFRYYNSYLSKKPYKSW